MAPSKVVELFPAFADELQRLVERSARPDLAEQVRDLPVVGRCQCGDDNCAHFYTAPPPAGAYGVGHSNVLLAAEQGLVVIDVMGNRIVAVEVLDRPDVKVLLDRYIPLKVSHC